jgi:quercetin dioxygenase-like cupin family protein
MSESPPRRELLFGKAGVAGLSPPAKSLDATRLYTQDNGKTTIGKASYAGNKVAPGEGSIVPAGCTRFLEGPAFSMVIRSFPPKFTSPTHTDPAQTHQLAFLVEGTAAGHCDDGMKFVMKPGDFASVEDSVGDGHAAYDGGTEGFVQVFISRPSNR